MSIEQLGDLAVAFGIPDGLNSPEFAINAYRVTYEMPYLDSIVMVSGAMYVPQGINSACGMPTMTYMHGTVFKRSDAPSFMSSEGQMGFLMASQGFLTLLPDYVGLGTSNLLHPYIHAESEAQSGISLLQAAQSLGEELGYMMGDQHFLTGYSQGGHASMAMARAMQEEWSEEFPLTAAAPMSGPYDLTGTQFPLGFNEEAYSNPAYFAYTAMAWQSVYGDLYTDLSEWIIEPYASELPAMFDGLNSAGDINDYLPELSVDLLQPGLFETITAADHPFMLAAQDNNVYEWVPESPVQMYYCTLDEQVYYQNALVAEAYMLEQGSSTVTSINGGEYDHGGCALFSIFYGTLWCADQATFCETSGVQEEQSNGNLKAYPNPAADYVRIDGLLHGAKWLLMDASGRIVLQGVAGDQPLELNTGSLARGLYTLKGDRSKVVRIALH